MNPTSNKFKAQLVNSTDPTDRVIFEISPDISESRSVDYKNITPLHMPGVILAYAGTAPRTFQISSSKLVSDTQNLALKNIQILQQLRTWCLPRFGERNIIDTGDQSTLAAIQRMDQTDKKSTQPEANPVKSANRLGSPPPILYFSAYSDPTKSGLQNITRIPTVIESLAFNYTNEVDYIFTPGGIPFPIIMSVDITLRETHSPREYENFSLSDFRNGNLGGF